MPPQTASVNLSLWYSFFSSSSSQGALIFLTVCFFIGACLSQMFENNFAKIATADSVSLHSRTKSQFTFCISSTKLSSKKLLYILLWIIVGPVLGTFAFQVVAIKLWSLIPTDTEIALEHFSGAFVKKMYMYMQIQIHIIMDYYTINTTTVTIIMRRIWIVIFSSGGIRVKLFYKCTWLWSLSVCNM